MHNLFFLCQMISCRTRGFSFTRALLGIPSDELHVCGDPAAIPLIQKVLEVTNDIIEVRMLLLFSVQSISIGNIMI